MTATRRDFMKGLAAAFTSVPLIGLSKGIGGGLITIAQADVLDEIDRQVDEMAGLIGGELQPWQRKVASEIVTWQRDWTNNIQNTDAIPAIVTLEPKYLRAVLTNPNTNWSGPWSRG